MATKPGREATQPRRDQCRLFSRLAASKRVTCTPKSVSNVAVASWASWTSKSEASQGAGCQPRHKPNSKSQRQDSSRESAFHTVPNSTRERSMEKHSATQHTTAPKVSKCPELWQDAFSPLAHIRPCALHRASDSANATSHSWPN